MANPQRIYGADVISRIAYTQRETKGVEKLQEVLIAALNQLIMELCQAASVEREEILAMTIAANTVILHTLLGVSAASIAAAPFEPLFTEAKAINNIFFIPKCPLNNRQIIFAALLVKKMQTSHLH